MQQIDIATITVLFWLNCYGRNFHALYLSRQDIAGPQYQYERLHHLVRATGRRIGRPDRQSRVCARRPAAVDPPPGTAKAAVGQHRDAGTAADGGSWPDC